MSFYEHAEKTGNPSFESLKSMQMLFYKHGAKIRKDDTYIHIPEEVKEDMAKSMKLGGGGRFQKLKNKLESQGKSATAAKAIAAAAGRKKYGAAKMSKMATAGRKRAAK